MTDSAQPVPDLGILVLLGYQGFVRQLHDDMATHGFDDLGRSDGVVMRVLSQGSRKVSELAMLLEISPQGAAQVIADMESRGYVVRTPDPGDARARLVELSERGRGAIAAARAFHRRFEVGVARRHGADARDTFRSILNEMAEAAPGGLDKELRALYL
ncbi:MarR family winged helix-turn-helix transcriptional regulator [Knoellia sp. CPCC 206453]|uniref:MarR family winged helix-turn-helix transcriptional regulator n=1 Tax=Knoellia pratensis TaxID=3404796 RepID=UPI00361524E4